MKLKNELQTETARCSAEHRNGPAPVVPLPRIFMPVPDEGFMEKSKHVARFGQYSSLTADTALIDGASVYLPN